ncbi:membrane protein [Enterobacter cloacae subsp. cloacae]|uniref:type VI secretion system protein TssA n=1 Tax=Enterobacter cloacae TaxID=550 RepID=UPI00063A8EF9|nr:type VI secretion system ImpA family N-terminal domain-containing protein [Enterobacter cloacae]KLG05258.1 membrane protein [Enterobacter cloacae subsp. cloacae]
MNQIYRLTCSDYYQPLMSPIAGSDACGENLDYDPAFIMLQSRLQPRMDVEYGSFFEAADPINWVDTERECQTLLQKSKDVRLIIILMRCRLRKIGLAALAEGLEALNALLNAWPDDLHPQLLDEGEFAPMLRANAYAELEDANGLLADLRNQQLPKAAGLQISIKEFEKAHQVPREEGALSDTAIAAIIHEWQLSARDSIYPITQAHYFLAEIRATLTKMLAHDAPELAVLTGLLAFFANDFGSGTPVAAAALPVTPEETLRVQENVETAVKTPPVIVDSSPVAPPVVTEVRRGIGNRADALHRLQEVRSWFAMTEPSSPLIQVLKYAEESIGKSFADLLKMYPPEIVAMLNQEKE